MNDIDISALMNAHQTQNFGESDKEYTPTQGRAFEQQYNDQKNIYLSDTRKGLSLCSSLIARTKSYGRTEELKEKIERLIKDDFLQHTSNDDNTRGAKAYAELLAWYEQVLEACAFPRLEQHHTVAIGGSFSAGKTEFLNTVLGCPSLLPTDTTPTTSIPTYIYQGDENNITALNFYGKKTAINEEALKAICHAFTQEYDVTFSHILQMISVERQQFNYQNLIFLDTPGYSKADDIANQKNRTDEDIARAHLRAADHLIWLVDCQNGTVPKPDLDFLSSLDLQQPITLVLSKADKKIRTEVEQIIAVAKESLEREGIPFNHVIGYSAHDDIEISEQGNVLTTMLSEINTVSQGSTLKWQLEQVIKGYINQFDVHDHLLKFTYGSLQELLYSEKFQGEEKQQLTEFHGKLKKQRNALFTQKDDTRKISQKLHEALKELAKLLEITLADRPSVMQAISMQKKRKTVQSATESYTFNALVKGDMQQLGGVSDLSKLSGEITKVSPVGVSIKLQDADQLEMMILKSHITKQAPHLDYLDIEPGLSVTAQLLGANRALVAIIL